jgi:hypothetical protein
MLEFLRIRPASFGLNERNVKEPADEQIFIGEVTVALQHQPTFTIHAEDENKKRWSFT